MKKLTSSHRPEQYRAKLKVQNTKNIFTHWVIRKLISFTHQPLLIAPLPSFLHFLSADLEFMFLTILGPFCMMTQIIPKTRSAFSYLA